ncbi:hypothetical protein L596_026136 [Steinernema carpocapsae]|uniref:G-protein coupled receptors family 1 profile domain-containing protein n=1 Tax=Steinernema carpocapsae TaxID=34508 RepID=A0A4U5M0H3_STECR|nr:hypothetical protein L596_026136 [Steinernema carpocapsae]
MVYKFEELPYEHRWTAVITITFAIIAMITNLSIIRVFLTNPKFKTQVSYTIMAGLSIFECILLFAYSMFGVFCLAASVFHPIIENFVVSLLDTAWYGVFLCTTLLAFNRFVILSEIAKLRNRFYLICLGFIWVLCLINAVISISPLVKYVYWLDLALAPLDFRATDTWSIAFSDFKYYFTIFLVGLSLALYIFVVIALIVKRRQVTSNRTLISNAEMRIMIQAVMIFLVCALNVTISYKASQFVDVRSVAMHVLGTIVQINFAFANPILYLVVNRELRNTLFGKKVIHPTSMYG